MYWRFICILSALVINVGIYGQSTDIDETEDYAPRWLGSMYMDVAFPLQQFDVNMGDVGLGVGGEFLYNVQYQQPVWVGIGVHSFSFDDYSLIYTEIFDGEFFDYEETTASRLFIAHAVVRFQPEIDFILQPYVQGGFGMHWFFTNTKIEDVALDDVVDRIGENSDSVFGYSLHAGIQFVPKGQSNIRGDVRVGYFKNPSVEYMRYNSELGDVDSFPIEYFETRISAVDALGLHGGVTIMF